MMAILESERIKKTDLVVALAKKAELRLFRGRTGRVPPNKL